MSEMAAASDRQGGSQGGGGARPRLPVETERSKMSFTSGKFMKKIMNKYILVKCIIFLTGKSLLLFSVSISNNQSRVKNVYMKSTFPFIISV